MVDISKRWDFAVSSVKTVTDSLQSVNGSLTAIVKQLTTTFDKITDPKYGMIAGLNCIVIG